MNFDDLPEVRDWSPRYAVSRKTAGLKSRKPRQTQADGVGQVGIICGVTSILMLPVSYLACGFLVFLGIPIAMIGFGAAIQSKHEPSRYIGIILSVLGFAACVYWPAMFMNALRAMPHH